MMESQLMMLYFHLMLLMRDSRDCKIKIWTFCSFSKWLSVRHFRRSSFEEAADSLIAQSVFVALSFFLSFSLKTLSGFDEFYGTLCSSHRIQWDALCTSFVDIYFFSFLLLKSTLCGVLYPKSIHASACTTKNQKDLS